MTGYFITKMYSGCPDLECQNIWGNAEGVFTVGKRAYFIAQLDREVVAADGQARAKLYIDGQKIDERYILPDNSSSGTVAIFDYIFEAAGVYDIRIVINAEILDRTAVVVEGTGTDAVAAATTTESATTAVAATTTVAATETKATGFADAIANLAPWIVGVIGMILAYLGGNPLA